MGLVGSKVKSLAARRDVAGLRELLEHRSPRVRMRVVCTLGEPRDPSTTDDLIAAIKENVVMRSKHPLRYRFPEALSPLSPGSRWEELRNGRRHPSVAFRSGNAGRAVAPAQ